MGGSKARVFLALQLLLLCYALSTVMQKLAAMQTFLSPRFLLCALGMFLFLGVYALGWQQVLKRLPLTVAFANKSAVMIWGMIAGAIMWHERISWLMILGTVIIIVGVCLVVIKD